VSSAYSSPYRGRFAPSPTGPLHLGSLLAALGSYLEARVAGGTWLVRIEDIDPPREVPGADALILQTLRSHGLVPDEAVLYQSTRHAAYAEAVSRLLASGVAFHCTCSRQDLEQRGGRHAASCPQSQAAPDEPATVRVRTHGSLECFVDLIGGEIRQRLAPDSFVVRRRDGLYAYHLAVVVDDAFQHITHVIRGRDLLDSTPCHLLLQRLLGLPVPRYGHLPLLLNPLRQKLSKQNLATAVDNRQACANLATCLRLLGQPAPPPRCRDDQFALLEWAIARWDRNLLPQDDQVFEGR
jgi:glutamyl-Q tRNA(Asp) synthetase